MEPVESRFYKGQLALAMESLLPQMAEVRKHFGGFPNASPDKDEMADEDPVFAKLLAKQLIAYALRPKAIQSTSEILPSLRTVDDAATRHISLNHLANLLAISKSVYRGHFELPNGKHTRQAFISGLLGSSTAIRKQFSLLLANLLQPLNPQTIVGSTAGGGLLAQDIAKELNCDFALFECDESENQNKYKGSGSIERVAIVDDVLITGRHIERMRDTLGTYPDAQLVGVAVLATMGERVHRRLESLKSKGIAAQALVSMNFPEIDLETCELCACGIPITFCKDLNGFSGDWE